MNVLAPILAMHTMIRAHRKLGGSWCRRWTRHPYKHCRLCASHITYHRIFGSLVVLWSRARATMCFVCAMGHCTLRIVKNSSAIQSCTDGYYVVFYTPSATGTLCLCERERERCRSAYYKQRIQRGENRKLSFAAKPFALVAFTICHFRRVKNFGRNKPCWHQFYDCINAVRAHITHNTKHAVKTEDYEKYVEWDIFDVVADATGKLRTTLWQAQFSDKQFPFLSPYRSRFNWWLKYCNWQCCMNEA